MVFRDRDRLRRWLNYTAANWLMDAVAIAVIAYVVSAPLVAYHFHLFSPYAAPLSLLLAPVVAAVLVPGYVSMALAWPMPNLAYAFGQLAAWAADGLARIGGGDGASAGAVLRPARRERRLGAAVLRGCGGGRWRRGGCDSVARSSPRRSSSWRRRRPTPSGPARPPAGLS